MEQLIFEIKIIVTDTAEVKGAGGTAGMVLFKGEVNSRLFVGKVLPGAVDTQIKYCGKSKTLSARYMLEGTDAQGCKCRIFIENNGTEQNGLIVTAPRLITDSPLWKRLETADLKGTVFNRDGELIVRIVEMVP